MSLQAPNLLRSQKMESIRRKEDGKDQGLTEKGRKEGGEGEKKASAHKR